MFKKIFFAVFISLLSVQAFAERPTYTQKELTAELFVCLSEPSKLQELMIPLMHFDAESVQVTGVEYCEWIKVFFMSQQDRTKIAAIKAFFEDNLIMKALLALVLGEEELYEPDPEPEVTTESILASLHYKGDGRECVFVRGAPNSNNHYLYIDGRRTGIYFFKSGDDIVISNFSGDYMLPILKALAGLERDVTYLRFSTELNKEGFGDENARILAAALKVNALPHLKKLDIWEQNLGDRGLQALAAVLSFTGIEELNLWRNKLSFKTMQILCEGLPQTKLKALKMGWCHMGDAGAALLANVLPQTQLVDLDLGKNDLTVHGVRLILESLKGHETMRRLCLEGKCEKDDKRWVVFTELLPQTPLTYFSVYCNGFSNDNVVVAFVDCLPKTQLEGLHMGTIISSFGRGDVTNYCITDKLAEVLPHTHIRDLSFNACTHEGAKQIRAAMKGRGFSLWAGSDKR